MTKKNTLKQELKSNYKPDMKTVNELILKKNIAPKLNKKLKGIFGKP